jgi:hypothetical protein
MTLSLTALSTMGIIVTLDIHDTQHDNIVLSGTYYCYAGLSFCSGTRFSSLAKVNTFAKDILIS